MATVVEPYYWWVRFDPDRDRWVVNNYEDAWTYTPPPDIRERVMLLDAASVGQGKEDFSRYGAVVVPGVGWTVRNYRGDSHTYRFMKAEDDGTKWHEGVIHELGEDDGTGTST